MHACRCLLYTSGIQADLKTISALGGYAATAITAITVQNTLGVRAIHQMCIRDRLFTYWLIRLRYWLWIPLTGLMVNYEYITSMYQIYNPTKYANENKMCIRDRLPGTGIEKIRKIKIRHRPQSPCPYRLWYCLGRRIPV